MIRSDATRTITAGGGTFRSAFADLAEGLSRYHLWWSLAQEDFRQAYRETAFGLMWAILSYTIFAIAIILAFTGGKPSPDFAGYVIIGLLVWNFINAVVLESSSVFIGAESFIKGIRLPLTLHVFRCVARIGVNTLYASIGAAVLMIVFRAPVSPAAVAAIPALLLLAVTSIPVQILLGVLCTYSRDFKYIIDNLMRPVFFVTPIFWVAPRDSLQAALERYNPFTHFIQIVRSPIVYGAIPWGSWTACLLMSALFWVGALFVLRKFRSQLVFWL